MPPVQTYVIGKFLKSFSEVTGFQGSIKAFRMLWFDRLEISHVQVIDPEGNTMIHAKEILVNFSLISLFGGRDIAIDGIFLDSAHVYLTKMQESDTSRDLNMNIFISRIEDAYGGRGGGNRGSTKISIGEAMVNRSIFSLVDQDSDSVLTQFDHNHFTVDVDEAQLNGFTILGDTIEFDLRTLIAHERRTDFTIKQLSTYFRISQSFMEFLGLHLEAGSSMVTDTVVFLYDGQRQLNDFFNKVVVQAHLKNTILNPNDLAIFLPEAEQLRQSFTVSGYFNGRINRFKFSEMELDYGRSILKGSLDMDGLPDFNETFIIANLKNSFIDMRDLALLLNNENNEQLLRLGDFQMNGQFLGYPTDFVANGDFTGKLGNIKSDINLKINEKDVDLTEYSGKLAMFNVNLGEYLDDTTSFQNVTMNGRISGKGLSRQTADFRLNGAIQSIGLNGYNYTNIKTNARFAAERFDGSLEINDPNLEFKARGQVDLRKGQNVIKIQASIDTAYLHNLRLSNEYLFIHSVIDCDLKGLKLDSISGTADLKDLRIDFKDQSLRLDEINLISEVSKERRSLSIQSTLMDASIIGDYYYTKLANDIQALTTEILLNIQNDQAAIQDYYQQKKSTPTTYRAKIDITLKDIEPFSELMELDLDISPNTKIDGTFTSGFTTIFQAFTSFDSLRYQNSTWVNSEVDLTLSKIADSTNVLALASIISQQQQFGKVLRTKDLLVEGVWNKSHIDFTLDANQAERSNYIRLKGVVDFLKDSTTISMEPSRLMLLEREWNFRKSNYIAINGSDWKFSNLVLENNNQAISLNGNISNDPSKILSLYVKQLDLSVFDVLTDKKFTGIMNADVDLSNFYDNPSIQNRLIIDTLTVNDFLIGDINGEIHWDTAYNKFDINLFADRLGTRIVNLTGDYTPGNRESPLAISARLNQANLKIIEPFIEDIISQINGTISGNFRVTGPLDAPLINGEGLVSDGQATITYLKTNYRFTGSIGLTPSSIYFKNIELTDAFRNQGKLDGTINHDGFSNMTINLNANYRNFQVLNTTLKDNDLFYGQAYATGTLSFTGPINNLKITAAARTDKNTRLYIPIGGTSSTETKEYINFVNFTDTTFVREVERNLSNKVNLTGLTIDMNISVTPDAYGEIIFDAKSGDIIRGRGTGDLKLQIDTKGEFNMFGPFEFTQGWYNFTLYDIINKEFEIRKGSQITWYGDPYQGVMNINASYNQLASLSPLITDPEVASSTQLRRKYPVQVFLKLEGPMLSPQIAFDIQAEDLPQNVQTDRRTVNLDLEFTAFKNRLDEQELKRQVFSLIILRRFSRLDESISASGSVFNSVSELLSNQLSYWMSQVDENLEIDVDLASMDQESFNTFQLRFSYTFLNGRLRVTGDGTFNNSSQNTNQGSNPSSVAGDWTVDYMLTADGKLRVKMYSRTTANPILNSVNNQTTLTSGASLIHTQNFNQLKELWSSSKEKKKKDTDTPIPNKDAVKEEDGSE